MCFPRKPKYRQIGTNPSGAQARVIRTKLTRLFEESNNSQKKTLKFYVKEGKHDNIHLTTIKQFMEVLAISKHILNEVDETIKDPNDYVPWIMAFCELTEQADVHSLMHKIEHEYKLDIDIIYEPELAKIREIIDAVPTEDAIAEFIKGF